MDQETKKKILDWIFENHEHHYDETKCDNGDSPYVNSLELEQFINNL